MVGPLTDANRRRHVMIYPVTPLVPRHQRASLQEIARRIAALLAGVDAGEFLPGVVEREPVYLLPSDTLVGVAQARAAGVHSESDLFGGVVPHAFVATKVITHPLSRGSTAPPGWADGFSRRVRDATLNGVSVFDLVAARDAGRQMLQAGSLRVKPVLATAGRGQVLVHTAAELDIALGAQDAATVSQVGLVLEEQLEAAVTHSVGQVRLAGMVASYVGTQRLTRDREGSEIYGGSSLMFVRGGFDVLLARDLSAGAAQAIAHARAYDAAAFECYPGLMASRRNYDVLEGRDASGAVRCGVLEQSWRVGGASSAEIVALQAFAADPRLQLVHADSVELHGEHHALEPDAQIFFRGVDEELGFLTKYAKVRQHGNT